MSVTLMAVDAVYNLRLGVGSHHQRVCSPASPESQEVLHQQDQPNIETPLRFSVVNILRPDFGRDAIINTKSAVSQSRIAGPHSIIPIRVIQHSPPVLPKDLSVTSAIRDAARLSPRLSSSTTYGLNRDRDVLSTLGGLASPLQRHGLSRSGSLESLASNRSSLAGSSATGTPSLSSAASTIGSESISGDSTTGTAGSVGSGTQNGTNGQSLWPAWVYCTRYSDRPSSGPRTRRVKRPSGSDKNASPEEKRPRTAFSAEQLARLKREFAENRYLTERRRQQLSRDLGLNEAQIKIWFQNKRAKIKKSSGQKNPLAIQLMAQGLYNHSTVPIDEDDEDMVPSSNQP